jgi:DNA-binding CsgD family transcriptional regulator
MAIDRELTSYRRRECALKFSFEHLLIGLAFLNARGEVCYRNPMADSLFNDHACIRVNANNRLMSTCDGGIQLQDLIEKTLHTSHSGKKEKGSAIGLRAKGKTIPLLVYVRLLQDQESEFYQDKDSPRAIVLLSDPERTLPHTKSYLRSTYGMTFTESEIAVMVGNGLSLQEIAGIRHTKMNTIRAQLKQIFHKTGVNRQSSLVKILVSGPFQLNNVA